MRGCSSICLGTRLVIKGCRSISFRDRLIMRGCKSISLRDRLTVRGCKSISLRDYLIIYIFTYTCIYAFTYTLIYALTHTLAYAFIHKYSPRRTLYLYLYFIFFPVVLAPRSIRCPRSVQYVRCHPSSLFLDICRRFVLGDISSIVKNVPWLWFTFSSLN